MDASYFLPFVFLLKTIPIHATCDTWLQLFHYLRQPSQSRATFGFYLVYLLFAPPLWPGLRAELFSFGISAQKLRVWWKLEEDFCRAVVFVLKEPSELCAKIHIISILNQVCVCVSSFAFCVAPRVLSLVIFSLLRLSYI